MTSVSGVGVIDKAVLILHALRARPLDLAELQQECDLPRATAHRLVVALEQHHLVRRDAQGRFCLGFELTALGRAASEQFALGEIAAPIMRDLRDGCGESVQLYVREDDGRRCVVSLQSPHALRWIVPEGSLLPLGVGSAGRVLAADLSGGDTSSRAGSGHGSDRAGSGRAESDRAGSARAQTGSDWIESVEEREAGVASVSAPVFDRSGAIVAAVSLSGPVERLTRAPGERFGPAVAEAGQAITDAIANLRVSS
jgi:DNA-binding IclR family transcriptional regulator